MTGGPDAVTATGRRPAARRRRTRCLAGRSGHVRGAGEGRARRRHRRVRRRRRGDGRPAGLDADRRRPPRVCGGGGARHRSALGRGRELAAGRPRGRARERLRAPRGRGGPAAPALRLRAAPRRGRRRRGACDFGRTRLVDVRPGAGLRPGGRMARVAARPAAAGRGPAGIAATPGPHGGGVVGPGRAGRGPVPAGDPERRRPDPLGPPRCLPRSSPTVHAGCCRGWRWATPVPWIRRWPRTSARPGCRT